MTINLEEGDLVLCTVDRIIGTNVFVTIETEQGELEGTLTFSEVAPGRIRNIRDYIIPKKKIICKILRISGNRIDLSLRRVTPKEQQELKEKGKQEKSYRSILKSVMGDKVEEIVKEIQKENSLYNFLQEAKENPKELELLIGKENSEKVLKILSSQKKKTSTIKKEISLSTEEPNGIELIKKLFEKIKNAEAKYISAGKYSIKIESNDIKKADQAFKETFTELEKEAKKNGLTISQKEKN